MSTNMDDLENQLAIDKMDEYRDKYAKELLKFCKSLSALNKDDIMINFMCMLIEHFSTSEDGRTRLIRDFEDQIYPHRQKLKEKDLDFFKESDFSHQLNEKDLLDKKQFAIMQESIKGMVFNNDFLTEDDINNIFRYMTNLCYYCGKYIKYRGDMPPIDQYELTGRFSNTSKKLIQSYIKTIDSNPNQIQNSNSNSKMSKFDKFNQKLKGL